MWEKLFTFTLWFIATKLMFFLLRMVFLIIAASILWFSWFSCKIQWALFILQVWETKKLMVEMSWFTARSNKSTLQQNN